MRVRIKVDPAEVKAGSDACLAITPIKKHARAYYMGTAMLADVRFAGGYITGELIHEAVEQDKPTHRVRGRMEKVRISRAGKFFVKDKNITNLHFHAAYVVGTDMFVSKEG